MSYLDRIAECNAHDLSGFIPFEVSGVRVGWLRPAFARHLAPHGEVFALDADAVRLAPGLAGPAARSEAVAPVLRRFAEDGLIGGWRNEIYPVGTRFADPPLMQIERAAVPFFGIRAYGIHVNGFVRDGDRLSMWVGRRARDKPTYPGMLDNFVAGGQPVGISLMDNLIKEAGEEAGVPPELARRARAVSAISYCQETEDGLKPDVMFCYDLELPADFRPRNTDGELEDFYLWPVEQVMETVSQTRAFKFNCNLVCTDFFVRHGLLSPDRTDYVEIVKRLRS